MATWKKRAAVTSTGGANMNYRLESNCLHCLDNFRRSRSHRSRDEFIQHVQGHVRLVHGHEMSGIVSLHEMEALSTAQSANNLSIQNIIVVVGSIECGLASPFKLLGPSLVAAPVAQVIHLASIDQSFNAILEKWRNHLMEIDHVVACTH